MIPDKFKHKLKSINWRSWAIQIALVFAAYWGMQLYQTRDAPQGDVPPVTGFLLNGDAIKLPDASGPVLVHFWATWCSICRLEKESIDSIASDHRVVAIASQSGAVDEVADHVAKNAITVPVLVDESGDMARTFGVKAFPTSFVVDAKGKIVDVEVGYTTEWGLRWRLWRASW